MKRRYIIFICLALVAAMVVGCHGSRRVATPTPKPKPQRVYTLVGFSAQAQGMNVSGQLRMAQDSVVWLTVSKLIEVGRALATPDSVHLRSTLMGIHFDGTYADLRRAYGISCSFAQLQSMAESERIETELPKIAKGMGVELTVSVKRREHPTSLTFPFR